MLPEKVLSQVTLSSGSGGRSRSVYERNQVHYAGLMGRRIIWRSQLRGAVDPVSYEVAAEVRPREKSRSSTGSGLDRPEEVLTMPRSSRILLTAIVTMAAVGAA